MSEKFEFPFAAGSVAAAVVPAARLRTTMSLTPPAVSPGRRLNVPAGASNETTWPSALMAERSVVPFAWTPPAFTAASVVVPAAMSRTTTSEALLPSFGKRFVASPLPNDDRPPVEGDVRVAEHARVRLLAARAHRDQRHRAGRQVLAEDVLVGVGVRRGEVRGRGGEDDVAPVAGDGELDVLDVLGVHGRVRHGARRARRGQQPWCQRRGRARRAGRCCWSRPPSGPPPR